MTTLPRKLQQEREAVLLANTPSFLYRHLRGSAAVEALKNVNPQTLSNLLQRVHRSGLTATNLALYYCAYIALCSINPQVAKQLVQDEILGWLPWAREVAGYALAPSSSMVVHPTSTLTSVVQEQNNTASTHSISAENSSPVRKGNNTESRSGIILLKRR